jgi:hypothetical protein
MNHYDERPATRGDLECLEERLAYRLKVLGAVLFCGLVVLFMALKW